VLVRVHADHTHRPTRIDVIDSGTGIPAERLGSIVEAFEQAEAGLRYGGTGLGLTISRSLLLQMGFGIEVESSVGRGTRFGILLEAEPAPADEQG
jgi:signal transduction histidine kinase